MRRRSDARNQIRNPDLSFLRETDRSLQSMRWTLPHTVSLNQKINDMNTSKIYITVSLEMTRKDGKPLTDEDIQDIVSQCDYSFSHKDVDIETEICGINEY